MKFYYFFLFVILTNLNCFSQSKTTFRYYDVANYHYVKMEYNKAMEMVDRALVKSPNFYEALILKALIFYDLNNEPAALRILDKCIEISNKEPLAYYHKGIIYFDDENYKKANDCFNYASKINRYNGEYFRLYAETLIKLDSTQKACLQLNEAISLEDKKAESLKKKHCQ